MITHKKNRKMNKQPKKNPTKWSLKCSYYEKNFNTLDALIKDVIKTGMDPEYMVTRNGKCTGESIETLIDPKD